jgi:hypothetical protein
MPGIVPEKKGETNTMIVSKEQALGLLFSALSSRPQRIE